MTDDSTTGTDAISGVERIQEGLFLIARAADQLRRNLTDLTGADRISACDVLPNDDIAHELTGGTWRRVIDTSHRHNGVHVVLDSDDDDGETVVFDHGETVGRKVA